MALIERRSLPRLKGGAVPEQTHCQRCGFGPLRGGEGNPMAVLLKRARTGVCVSCGLTRFIKSVPAMMMGIEKNGVEMLRDGRFGDSWARLLQSGHADATVQEIDWNRVVDNWDLPDRKPRPRRRS